MAVSGNTFTALMSLVPMLLLFGCTKGEISTVIVTGPPVPSAALAVVPQQGRKYWALAIAESPSDARRQALANCGNSSCMVVEEFAVGECAIVVQGDTQVFWGKGPEDDKGEVLNYCNLQTRNCQIAKYECLK
jgi:hypothetical protein